MPLMINAMPLLAQAARNAPAEELYNLEKT